MSKKNKRIIVAITGASGAIYGIKTLEKLNDLSIETHLIISKSAQITISYETAYNIDKAKEIATETHSNENIAAAIASGSFLTQGMIIAPCSIKTMSSISNGITSCLINRAADVCLKEKRKLVLMVRETPLHYGHLKTMTELSLMGAVIAPPVPAFYINPKSIDDIVNHSVLRVLDLFDINSPEAIRWKEKID